jgi:polygalacturonase
MTATTTRTPKLALTLLVALIPACAHAETKIFFANNYGAKGDGTTLNTAAIQKAIDAAAEAKGTATLKPGIYLTGSKTTPNSPLASPASR